jgi:acetolactate decarboxylase
MNAKITSLLMVSSVIVAFSVFIIFQQTEFQNSNLLFQVSTLDSLSKGSYEGKITTQDLLEHGDFGLGALAYMDGELICLDAACYQAIANGSAHELSPQDKITFASVVFFQRRPLPNPMIYTTSSSVRY